MRIGVFDSGIGGINVLKELVKKYPNNEYIFYGDTLNLPYGSKTIDELKTFASNIINYLISREVDIIIIACGTISSNCYDYLRNKYNNIPIYDIVSPTIRYIKESPYNSIGVIATERTIESKIFEQSDKVKQVKATKNFVKIIEDGIIEDNEIVEIKRELSSFKNNIDSLVLGCTHYPFISDIIKEYLNIPLIDMGVCLTNELNLSNDGNKKINLYFSDVNETLIHNIKLIISDEITINKLVINKK